jgi:hypothetical protein
MEFFRIKIKMIMLIDSYNKVKNINFHHNLEYKHHEFVSIKIIIIIRFD